MGKIVNTSCGQVQGRSCRLDNVVAFKGIRYATAGRWEYPTQVTHWDGIYDASNYGACSYQPRSFYDEELNEKKYFYYNEFRKGETYTYDEDCLFLNIFAPETAKEGDNLPVLIYIHGGGFTGGCGHEKHFDIPVWPTKGVIGVTLNYRLGPMGFVCLPELKEEAGFTGNYGLFDQLTAIKWVKENISAFGGNPDNMAIMGQSAGAMSVQQHCLSPLSEGLFHKAVMSSGGGVSKVLSAKPVESQYSYWQKAMEFAGCETLEQFRALTPKELFEAWDKTKKELKNPGCFPCIDGRLVIGSGSDLLAANKQHQIPYMAGTTSEDMMPPILFNMTKKWNAAQTSPSYTWYFDHQLPGDDNGAWHSADLWYWFGTLPNCWRPMDDKDYVLSAQMVNYLCNFVKNSNPNSLEKSDDGHLPVWSDAISSPNKAMCLDPQIGMRKPGLLKMIYTMLTNKAVGE